MWGIAKRQGNRFWYDHTKVRILLPQMSLLRHVPENILVYACLLPLVGAGIISVTNKKHTNRIKKIALHFSFLPNIFFLWALSRFKQSATTLFQHTTQNQWLPGLNLELNWGVDGISILFILLTTFLVPLCILSGWESVKGGHVKGYYFSFLLIEFLLVAAFCALNVFFFFLFFESILIPMFLIIGIWGSREKKVLASYYFFLYTLAGSVLMLLAIMYIHHQSGTTDYETLLVFKFTLTEQKLLWLCFFAAFAAKMPMIPIHLWLPEAHVEAPTAGSIILAGVLLKLGTYGFIRFSIPLFPEASLFFTPLVYSFSVLGVIYASFTAIRQSDMKKIIAYTSVAHMNVVMLGIFSFNEIGVEGAILQSVSHGFVASALFALIGVTYERFGTRTIKYYGGLVHVMPLYASVFLFFTLANIGFPGTSSFIGEFLILTGVFKVSTGAAFWGAISMVLGGCYSLWLYNRIVFGNFKSHNIIKSTDLNKREIFILTALATYTVLVGVFPNLCLSIIHGSVSQVIEIAQP